MLFSHKKCIGLSIDILDDETRLINFVCLKIKSKNITIVDRGNNLNTISDLKGIFDSDSFVFLSINGKGIINKRINLNSTLVDTSQDKLVNLVLPNANAPEFYAQKYITENAFFVSICRDNLLNIILTELEMVSCYPVKLSIGPYEISNILNFLDHKTLSTNTYQIEIEGQEIQDIHKLNTPESIDYTIEGDKINSNELIAFSAAVAATIGEDNLSEEYDLIESNKKNMTFAYNFKKRLMATLIIIFGVLLVNFLAYDFLFAKIEQSKKVNSNAAQNQMASLKLQEDYKQKKQFIVQKNWNANTSISEIIELLSSSAPNGLTIKQINYQAENNKKFGSSNLLKYQYKKIHVFGNVSSSNQLNNWMKFLVESADFKDVSLQNYQLNTTGTGNIFNLEILLK